MLLYPAFRMQKNLMRHTLGIKFWEGKRIALAEGRDKERRQTELLRILEERRREKLRNKEIRRKMGFLRYWLCLAQRNKYKVIPRTAGNTQGTPALARTPEQSKFAEQLKQKKAAADHAFAGKNPKVREGRGSPGSSRGGGGSSSSRRREPPTKPPGFGQTSPTGPGGRAKTSRNAGGESRLAKRNEESHAKRESSRRSPTREKSSPKKREKQW
jgi:hypothetical protein